MVVTSKGIRSPQTKIFLKNTGSGVIPENVAQIPQNLPKKKTGFGSSPRNFCPDGRMAFFDGFAWICGRGNVWVLLKSDRLGKPWKVRGKSRGAYENPLLSLNEALLKPPLFLGGRWYASWPSHDESSDHDGWFWCWLWGCQHFTKSSPTKGTMATLKKIKKTFLKETICLQWSFKFLVFFLEPWRSMVSIDANHDPSEVAVPNNCSSTSVPSAWSELGPKKHGDARAKGVPWVVFSKVYSWGMRLILRSYVGGYKLTIIRILRLKQPGFKLESFFGGSCEKATKFGRILHFGGWIQDDPLTNSTSTKSWHWSAICRYRRFWSETGVEIVSGFFLVLDDCTCWKEVCKCCTFSFLTTRSLVKNRNINTIEAQNNTPWKFIFRFNPIPRS